MHVHGHVTFSSSLQIFEAPFLQAILSLCMCSLLEIEFDENKDKDFFLTFLWTQIEMDNYFMSIFHKAWRNINSLDSCYLCYCCSPISLCPHHRTLSQTSWVVDQGFAFPPLSQPLQILPLTSGVIHAFVMFPNRGGHNLTCKTHFLCLATLSYT